MSRSRKKVSLYNAYKVSNKDDKRKANKNLRRETKQKIHGYLQDEDGFDDYTDLELNAVSDKWGFSGHKHVSFDVEDELYEKGLRK